MSKVCEEQVDFRLHRLIRLSIVFAVVLCFNRWAPAQAAASTVDNHAAIVAGGLENPAFLQSAGLLKHSKTTTATSEEANRPSINVSPAAANAGKGNKTTQASESSDELASELAALSGPAAGPSGGELNIEEFKTGGLTPLKKHRK